MNRRINHVCFMGVSLLFAIGMAMIFAGKDGRRTASTGRRPCRNHRARPVISAGHGETARFRSGPAGP